MLGLTPMDVGSVHSKLAEESFRHQVQVVMGDGNLNKERMDALAGAPCTWTIPCLGTVQTSVINVPPRSTQVLTGGRESSIAMPHESILVLMVMGSQDRA